MKISNEICAKRLLVHVCKLMYNNPWKEVIAMGGKTSAASKNKWISKAYDRINLTVPKGRQATVKALADAQGESVNGFINALLRSAAGLSEGEWKATEEE